MKKIQKSPVAYDHFSHLKSELFISLVRYAKSKGITVVIQWIGQKDCSTRAFDDHRITSNGAYGSQTDCVFCGRGPIRGDDIQLMDGFVADRNCFGHEMVERTGTQYLPATRYRAAMIIHQVWLPGSLDNGILNFATMISCHELGFQMPSTGPKSWEKLARASAHRLVKRLWKEQQLKPPAPKDAGVKPSNSINR